MEWVFTPLSCKMGCLHLKTRKTEKKTDDAENHQ